MAAAASSSASTTGTPAGASSGATQSVFKTKDLRVSRFYDLPPRYKHRGTVCTEHQRHILDVSMMALTLNAAGVKLTSEQLATLKRSFNSAKINMHPYGSKTANVGGDSTEGYTKTTSDASVMRSVEKSFKTGKKVTLASHGKAHVEKQVEVLKTVTAHLPSKVQDRIRAAYRKITELVVDSKGNKIVDGRCLPASEPARNTVAKRTSKQAQREHLFKLKSESKPPAKETTKRATSTPAPKAPAKAAAKDAPAAAVTKPPAKPVAARVERSPPVPSAVTSDWHATPTFAPPMHWTAPRYTSFSSPCPPPTMPEPVYTPPTGSASVGFTARGHEVFQGARGGYYHITSSGGAAYHPGGCGVTFL